MRDDHPLSPGLISSVAIAVADDASAVGAARRLGASLAAAAGLDAERSGQLALIVTELGTNLVKHATRGMLVLRALHATEGGGVEVLSLDRGPGMRNVAECLRDGYSTGGTFGTGLGAVRRAAAVFDIVSDQRTGTAIVARVAQRGAAPAVLYAGAVCVPQPGESACGDAWGACVSGTQLRVALVDGLGHGPFAATASSAALRAFYRHESEEPAAIVRHCHAALRTTRGAVMGLALLDRRTGQLSYAGVGNVAATLLEPQRRRGLASQNGIVGHHLPDLRVVDERLPVGDVLVLNSDGLSTRWSLEAYPGLLNKHPALIAGVLYRDFSRDRDDSCVLVLCGPEHSAEADVSGA